MRTGTESLHGRDEWPLSPDLSSAQPGEAGIVRESSSVSDVADNKLLARLPAEVLRHLEPNLQPLRLEQKQVLFRAHEPLTAVYFPDTAVVSLIARLESGQTLEVGLVGQDGVVGTALFPGITTMTCDGIVVIPGSAQRIGADVLRRDLIANESLHSAIGRYLQVLLVRSMQMSVCNVFHDVEQRCIRWLLSVHDLIGYQDIPLTHEAMATILGVRRPTVTVVMGSLRRAGLIDEDRGRILVRDRHRLESACCECYRVMKDEQHQLLGY